MPLLAEFSPSDFSDLQVARLEKSVIEWESDKFYVIFLTILKGILYYFVNYLTGDIQADELMIIIPNYPLIEEIK